MQMNTPKIFKDTINNRKERKKLSKLLSELNLIYGEFEILYSLLSNQPLRPSEIGSHLFCEPAAVSRIIKSLSHKSLINYQHDDEDRRQIFISLTKLGETTISTVISRSKDGK